jgi:regulator of protease activity HflC (stomatin/prohibitin superfamily)
VWDKEVRKVMEEEDAKKYVKWGILVIVVVVLLFGSFFTIPAGYRGVVLTFGKPSQLVAEEGIHLKVPFAQSIKKVEVRTQKIEATADSASLDLQDVQTTVALNYHVIPNEANNLYQNIGLSYRERVILPAIHESVKAMTAKFNAENLIARRPEVRNGIKELLSEKLSKYNVIVDSLNIVNFQFSEEFDRAIEAKVTAEQLKLKAEMDLERIKVEKEQRIALAEAEAEALRLQKSQITPDLIRLREVDAQIKAIEKWDGVMPEVTGGAIPFINVRGSYEQTQPEAA